MTPTRRWLAGAGASAALLLGLAVPAFAQDADATSSEQTTEQTTEQSSEQTTEDDAQRDTPARGEHDCGDRSADSSETTL